MDVAGQLLARHGGRRVTLQMIEHYLPAPEEVFVAGQGARPPVESGSEQGGDVVTPLGTYATERPSTTGPGRSTTGDARR
ncbi:MAG: hypothetical protein EBX36_01525 [Planctomycetia bacterium]|nr:hypothetical protein [Planctomycetia bacterium]